MYCRGKSAPIMVTVVVMDNVNVLMIDILVYIVRVAL